jgi:serine/threonine protein kinase
MHKKPGSHGQAPSGSGGRDLFDIVAGRFQPMCELGHGAVCRIHLARLDDGFLGNPRSIQTLRNEAAALLLANHPGVPRLVDSGFDTPDPYVAMEHIDGRQFSLYALKTKEEVLKAIIGVCSILSSIHRAGMVHKDIKPSNVMLTRQVHLLDFGLAIVPGMPDFAAGGEKIVGTLNYMAPEQTYPKARVDRRADIYSLGVMAYAFVCEYPYNIAIMDESHYVEAHRFQEAKPPHLRNPSIPPRLSYAILRAMQKNPNQRYQDAEDMADGLSDALEHMYDF